MSISQNKGKVDVAEQVGKAHARAGELEKKVEKLKKDVDLKVKEKELLEARANEAERKASELNSKFESVSHFTEFAIALYSCCMQSFMFVLYC